MTISSNTRTAGPFIGTGVLTSYPFTFKVFSTTDVLGVFTSAAGADTTLVNGTDFTVALNLDQNAAPGGTITYVPNGGILPTGAKLTFTSNLNNFQTLQLTNLGGFLPTVINDALDRCVILIQQAVRKANASLQFPLSDGSSISTTLPSATQRANMALIFDSSGNPIAGGVPSVPVSSAMIAVFQAISLAVARTALGLGALATLNIGARLINDGSGNLTVATAPAGTLTGNLTAATAAPTDNTLAAVGNALGVSPITPQGRLTLTTGVPVMNADVSAATSIFYAPYVGSNVPVFNGTLFQNYTFAQLTLALNTSAHLSGNLYDAFIFLNNGVVTIGTGPAWSSTSARGTGAGTTQLQQTNGIYTNANSIVLKNGVTTFSAVAAGQATYVGTFYATANGQTTITVSPAAAANGTNNIIGLYNAYNRIKICARCIDTTASWTYNSATVRSANGSNSNRISWLDGLQQTPVEAKYFVYCAPSSNGTIAGIGVDSTTASSGTIGAMSTSAGTSTTAVAEFESYPLLGLHYVQALEAIFGGGTGGFSGVIASSPSMGLYLNTEF